MAAVFLLVLTGATIWGITNVLQRYFFRDRFVPVEVMVVATMLGASLFAFGAQFVWFGAPQVSPAFWQFFAITAVLNIAFIVWENKSLQLEDASIVAPILGITPIFVVLTSWIILREFPTTLGLIGIAITVFGVYIVGLKRSDMGNLKFFVKPWSRLAQSKGARFALLVAVLASVALNFDKLTILHSNPMMRSFAVFFTVAVVVWSWSVWRGRWKDLDKRYFLPLFGVGVLIGLSDVLMGWGFMFAFGIVPYVASLKRFQLVVTTILAGIFLREGDWGFRLAASAIIVAGLALLAF